jgi:FkbM family methyltransferase
MSLFKKVAAQLPDTWQSELKRIHFRRQFRRGRFRTDEPEYPLLDSLIRPGDWVVDVGANVGHYTLRLSELVGREGRVFAFEPVPETFALLAANVRLSPYQNVTLLNAAVSSGFGVVGMSIPHFDTGLTNYYEARLSDATGGALSVVTVSLDALGLDRRIALVKIDAEGHEAPVLAGMRRLLEVHRPVLIVETGSQAVIDDLSSLGYVAKRLPGSPNILFTPAG